MIHKGDLDAQVAGRVGLRSEMLVRSLGAQEIRRQNQQHARHPAPETTVASVERRRVPVLARPIVGSDFWCGFLIASDPLTIRIACARFDPPKKVEFVATTCDVEA